MDLQIIVAIFVLIPPAARSLLAEGPQLSAISETALFVLKKATSLKDSAVFSMAACAMVPGQCRDTKV